MDISSLLSPNQTTAYAQGYSTGDVYMINALGVQIDVNAAKPEIKLQVDKLEAKVGDTLTYTMQITNKGTTNSDNSILTGLIPAQTSYVNDSLTIDGKAISGNNPSTNLGMIKPGQTINATYQVKVTAAPETGKFVNTAGLEYEYTMVTGEQPVKDSTKSNEVITLYSENPNVPPVAVDDSAQTGQDTQVTIDVLINDSDKDGNLEPNSLNIIKNPSNGSLMTVNGKVNYTPKTGFNGNDSFDYQICDTKQLCDTATVNIKVNPKPIELNPPVAIADISSTPVNTPVLIDILKNDSFSDQNYASAKLTTTSEPSNGKVTYTEANIANYTPNSDFVGTDTFEYKLCDKTELCAVAKVTVNIKAPEVKNNPPLAINDSVDTSKNTPVVIDVLKNDSDQDGNLNPDSLKVTIEPSKGIFEKTGTQIKYTPVKDFVGNDTFSYEICDSLKLCSTTSVNIRVLDDVIIVTPPTVTDTTIKAEDDNAKTQANTKVVIPVLSNDQTSSTFNKASLKVLTPAKNGTTTVNPDGTLSYTPNKDYSGPDTFDYQICNSENVCAQAQVKVEIDASTVIITPTYPKPIAVNDQVKTNPGIKVIVSALQNDSAPGDKLDLGTLKITQNPSNGDVVADIKTGEIVYTPKPSFKGVDTFNYQICNTKGECATATVSVSVVEPSQGSTNINNPAITSTPIDATPKANPEVLGTQESTSNSIESDGTQVDNPIAYPLYEGEALVIDKQSEISPTTKRAGQVLGVSDLQQVLVRTGGEFGLNIFLPLNIGLIAIIFVLNRYSDKKQSQMTE